MLRVVRLLHYNEAHNKGRAWSIGQAQCGHKTLTGCGSDTEENDRNHWFMTPEIEAQDSFNLKPSKPSLS